MYKLPLSILSLLICTIVSAQSPAAQYHSDIVQLVKNFEPYETAFMKRLENFSADSIQEIYNSYQAQAGLTLEELNATDPWEGDALLRDNAREIFSNRVSFAKNDFRKAVALIKAGADYKPKKDEMSKSQLMDEVLPSYKKKNASRINIYNASASAFLQKYGVITKADWEFGCGELNKLMSEQNSEFRNYKGNDKSVRGAVTTYQVTSAPVSCIRAFVEEQAGSHVFEALLYEGELQEALSRYGKLMKVMKECMPVQWALAETPTQLEYKYAEGKVQRYASLEVADSRQGKSALLLKFWVVTTP